MAAPNTKSGSQLISGYIRIGSHTPPLNITDGDVTGTRLSLGTDVTFGANVGTLAILTQTSAATGAGANVLVQATHQLAPGGDSASEFRALNFQQRVASTVDHNFSGRFSGGYFEGVRAEGSGNFTSTSLGGIVGVTGVGAAYGSGNDDAGTISESAGVVGLGFNRATVTFTTKALTLARGLYAPNPTALGGLVLGTYVGCDIAALTSMTVGTGRIGLRNADITVFTAPTAQAITAAGDTISPAATYVEISNTTGGSITLTSAPTIPNGSHGQVLILMNVGTQNVVIQDQGTLASSNLRLMATGITLAPRQSIWLIYSTTVGDWVQLTALSTVI